ncbi:MAG: hypothetical protein V4721_10570 [Bacteroidota bacterium]
MSDEFAFSMKPFYESTSIKPLLQNAIVLIKGRKCRVERWFFKDQHCYIFIDIDIESKEPKIKPFGAKPSQVQTAINSNKITILKYGTEHFFD